MSATTRRLKAIDLSIQVDDLKEENNVMIRQNARLLEEMESVKAERDAAFKPCTWSLYDDDRGTWAGSCGTYWTFIDDGPAENGLKFCPHCGHPVVVVENDARAALEGK